MKAQIVVGLGYGDEGKGITTDYLCFQADNPIVIRFSGGQQAGHTVIFNGKKHIHSNFGSGTLRGIPTYFTEHTTFYPTTIIRERAALNRKDVLNSRLILHPLAKMTTPYDVFLNRADQENLEHGTCGLGIGKTMLRNEGPYKLYAVDLTNIKLLEQKMSQLSVQFTEQYPNTALTRSQLEELEDFWHAVTQLEWEIEDYDFLLSYEELIFEGSQGTMLDMDHGVHPHTTWANTTVKNAMEILNTRLPMIDIDVFFVTRSYSTRHGADPNYIHQILNLTNNQEEINTHNQWQREFKTAPLDESLLEYAFRVNSAYALEWSVPNLVITCCDQFPETISQDFKNKFNQVLSSWSPESKDFKNHKNMGNASQERFDDKPEEVTHTEETTTTTEETHTEESTAPAEENQDAASEGTEEASSESIAKTEE